MDSSLHQSPPPPPGPGFRGVWQTAGGARGPTILRGWACCAPDAILARDPSSPPWVPLQDRERSKLARWIRGGEAENAERSPGAWAGQQRTQGHGGQLHPGQDTKAPAGHAGSPI